MVVCTNIYAPNEQTQQTVKSFERFGYEIAMTKAEFPYGRVFNNLVQMYRRASTGHETFVYSDGGDTFCQRPFTVPSDRLIWSTEKQCFPHPEMAKEYPKPTVDTPWRYLNNGGYCGNLKLALEFFDKYVGKLPLQANCQLETMQAFIKAKKDGFPIELDYGCELFQSIAFDPVKPAKGKKIDKASYSIHLDENGVPKYGGTDFIIRKGKVVNKLTKTTPAILHGNGGTPMQWIYQL